MKTPKFPYTVKAGSVSVRIRKFTQTKKGKVYNLFVVDYSLLGKRKRDTRASFDEALLVANDACKKIDEGRQASLTLTANDRDIYLRAVEAINPTGIALDAAAKEFESSFRILGNRISLIEACREWLRRNPTNRPIKTLKDAVSECIADQEKDGKSKDRVKQLNAVFNKLSADLNLSVSELTTGIISQWLMEKTYSDRTRKNYRDGIGFLCRWCVIHGYLEKGTDWLEGVQKYSARKLSEIEIYSPQEIRRLLNVAGSMTPFIAIAAFAGLRHAEIARLDWSEIDLEDGFIEVIAAKSKTGERRLVPIHENLKKWLQPFYKKTGNVAPFVNTSKQLLKIAKSTRQQITETEPEIKAITWKHNALRHSFISYRVAESGDVPRTSDEAGNSPAIIRQHYLRRVKPTIAAEWFGIIPPENKPPALLQNQPETLAA